MAAISDNKYEVYEWVKKVIDSCETSIHLTRANRLINSFTELHDDWFLRQSLRDYKDTKWRKLVEKVRESRSE
jgi:hypothetical protein